MNETNAILQVVIDHPELQQYYHVDELPDRAPLRIVLEKQYCDQIDLTKFGEPVLVVSEISGNDEEMIVEKVEGDGRIANVSLRYPVEGISATFKLTKEEDSWMVEEASIFEN